MVTKAFMNWSGGKDSALALYRCREMNLHVDSLLTNRVAGSNRVSMHGVRWELIEAQAASIGLPLKAATLPEEPVAAVYEEEVARQVQVLKAQGFTTTVFGDIFLEDLKAYREAQAARLGVNASFPLWGANPSELMTEFISSGFKAVIVCVDAGKLDPSFCGRLIDGQLIADLPQGIDVCGEQGEYHSFVFDGPIFRQPVPFKLGSRTVRSYAAPGASDSSLNPPDRMNFVYCDLLPRV